MSADETESDCRQGRPALLLYAMLCWKKAIVRQDSCGDSAGQDTAVGRS